MTKFLSSLGLSFSSVKWRSLGSMSCPSSSPMRLRLTAGVYGVCAHAHCLWVCLPVCTDVENQDRENKKRLDFLLAFSSELVKTVSSNEIHKTTLHTCDSLLHVRSKCSNTNELAITSETNPDNAVRNCQRNPPKKQEQSLQGQPISKCSNSNRRGNFCLR